VTETPTGRASDKPALIVACVALVAVFAASALVGWIGAPHDKTFSWELASIFGTALGTTLLAAATGWLAWSTRSEVRATQDLAELTRRQQAASERPLLLARVLGWSGVPENGSLAFELHNVGLGPALRIRVRARYTGHPGAKAYIEPTTISAIEPSSTVRVDLHAVFPEPGDIPGGVVSAAFDVGGTYVDRSMENEDEIIARWPEDGAE
jgi:hypothetical protein